MTSLLHHRQNITSSNYYIIIITQHKPSLNFSTYPSGVYWYGTWKMDTISISVSTDLHRTSSLLLSDTSPLLVPIVSYAVTGWFVLGGVNVLCES